MLCIGFPTSVLYTLRRKYHLCQEASDLEHGLDVCDDDYSIPATAGDPNDPDAPDSAAKRMASLDLWSLKLFFVGIYKDGRESEQGRTFYITFALLLIGLSIEKQAINWLKDRSGCTYPRLQKFVELDVRRAAIRYDWEKARPRYDPKRYDRHYFYDDFEEILPKCHSGAGSGDGGSKADKEEGYLEYFKKDNSAFGRDFIPYKSAERLAEAIRFTLRIDCRASDLEVRLDDPTKAALD